MSHPRPPVLLGPATALLGLASAASLGMLGWLLVDASRSDAPTWLLGRAGGLAAYLLLVALVVTGLLLAHPWARHLRWPSPRARLAVHATLATFTAAFTALHVAALAVDPWAGVGWAGALVPMASAYRPVPVTLGVVALWSGLVTGLTAALAGRLLVRVWWPIHTVAAGSLVLVWAHSVLAGSDVVALQGLYLSTGTAVVALAVTRYAARTPADRVVELTGALARAAEGVRR